MPCHRFNRRQTSILFETRILYRSSPEAPAPPEAESVDRLGGKIEKLNLEKINEILSHLAGIEDIENLGRGGYREKENTTNIQRTLVALGFDIGYKNSQGVDVNGIDGDYGNKTRDAVRKLQQQLEFTKVDGIFGNDTLGKLDALLTLEQIKKEAKEERGGIENGIAQSKLELIARSADTSANEQSSTNRAVNIEKRPEATTSTPESLTERISKLSLNDKETLQEALKNDFSNIEQPKAAKKVQVILVYLGYDISYYDANNNFHSGFAAIDGYYGKKTASAVVALKQDLQQSENNITLNNIFDNKTASALLSIIAPDTSSLAKEPSTPLTRGLDPQKPAVPEPKENFESFAKKVEANNGKEIAEFIRKLHQNNGRDTTDLDHLEGDIFVVNEEQRYFFRIFDNIFYSKANPFAAFGNEAYQQAGSFFGERNRLYGVLGKKGLFISPYTEKPVVGGNLTEVELVIDQREREFYKEKNGNRIFDQAGNVINARVISQEQITEKIDKTGYNS